ERSMNAEEALGLLGQIAARFAQGEDLSRAAPALVDLALAAYKAKAAFVARVESEAGLALRWLHGRERDGKVLDPQQQARMLARVEAALREASSGVVEAPPPGVTGADPPRPAMTAAAPPHGAIAVKSDAGNPPLHCFPLLKGEDPTSDVLGVIG